MVIKDTPLLIDCHAHIWDGRFEEDKQEIVAACRRYPIERVCVSGLGVYQPDQEEIERLNLETFRFMKEEPDLIRGFCTLNPTLAGSLTELRTCIEDRAMSGLKLWVATFCDDPLVNPLVEYCIRQDIPVLLHAWHKAIGQLPFETRAVHIASLAQRYPEARLIMAHLSGNCQHELKIIQPFDNVVTDFSGTIFRNGDLAYAIRLLGPERVLFGSDMPGANLLVSWGQVEDIDLSSQDKSLICWGNARRIIPGL
ncbi:MAG: amidohydrolase [Ruminococcaceae bacterium]|nr:amidohydrolase [Oscillospiraceae bacterium]